MQVSINSQICKYCLIQLSFQSFAGWKNPIELGVFFDQVNGNEIEDRGEVQINEYRIYDLLRHVEVENVTCQDPAWMDTDSFYPDGKAMHKIIKSL